jgi:type IV pilus assembly protein PilW
MNAHRLPHCLQTPQGGMSLAELLVALALGLGVLLAGGVLMTGANRAYVAHEDAAAIDDGGRHALALIGRAVRQGAFIDWERMHAAPVPELAAPLAGLDSRSLVKTSAGIDNPLKNAIHGSDVLAVRHAGAGAPPHGDGSVIDCAGFPVHAAREAWSIFYVARNGDGLAELRCKYRGAANWSADAVVAGVEGFQVLYGLDTDTPPDGMPNRYVNASALAALDAALAPAGAGQAAFNANTWWKRVASVQVALLLHGERPSAAPIQPGAYALFGTAYSAAQGDGDAGVQLAAADLRGRGPAPSRRLFTAVFAVGAAQP